MTLPSATPTVANERRTATRFTLVSHALCPYVQRAAIVLREKGVAFERRDVDLAKKPGWFLAISPLAKTPVLLAGDEPIFESAVICEYLEDTLVPRLHPQDALERARHRGWIEFASALLDTIAGFYNAPNAAALEQKRVQLRQRFVQLEQALGAGPYFAGTAFSIVDAAFGPVFRYFDVFDTIENFGVMHELPKVCAWRAALRSRASVRDAVGADYAQRLYAFLVARGSELSKCMLVAVAAPA